MTAIEETVQNLKNEISDILKRYDIPLDDRSFILDKVEEGIAAVMQLQRKRFESQFENIKEDIGLEREKIRETLNGMREAAYKAIEDLKEENEKKVEKAYEDGVNEGLSQAAAESPKGGLSTIQIVLGLFFAFLAFVTVISAVFGKERKN